MHEQLPIVIVLLLADAECCECDGAARCGGEVVYALTGPVEKSKSSVMTSKAMGRSPQLGSSMVFKESWWLEHHSDLQKPV